jgi:histidine triad (HIT) family protein
VRDCVFCRLIATRPDGMRFRGRDDTCAVFEPLNPVTPGHLLVVPVEHVDDAVWDHELTGAVFATAAVVLFQMGEEGNLITSVGENATQSVRHLHVHVVPRREGDGLHLPWTGQVTT